MEKCNQNNFNKVYLVGAGPGDPDLLTLRAIKVIRAADAVLYDALIDNSILEYAPPGCELLFVGKRCGKHEMTQDKINELLVQKGLQHKKVVRLKGGDPLVFGRGCEEIQALIAAGLSFEIVPGVTSALAGPTYAGIGVTNRGFSSAVAIITGHENPEKKDKELNWGAFAGVDTLVLLMAVTKRSEIAKKLIENNRNPEDPVAFIENATTAKQKIIRTTLTELVNNSPHVTSPAVMVVGQVASVENSFEWLESSDVFTFLNRPEVMKQAP